MAQTTITIRGRKFQPDTALINQLLYENPAWGRSRLSVKLCELWDWRAPNGQIKDMACRNLLLRLEKAGHIVLPPRQRKSPNEFRNRAPIYVQHCTDPIDGALASLLPIRITCVTTGSKQDRLFRCLLAGHHYLGYKNTAGENMKYLVHSQEGLPLACILFSAAAWKCASRDIHIGWTSSVCERNLHSVANNARFLILPWVRVPHLASHILSRVARRVSRDWMDKYAHPIYLLESFVDRSRYRGTCYKAANWTRTGQTTGRTRNDQYNTIRTSIKDVYIYPLTRRYLGRLCHET
ncbi:MAG: Druantia anti-phage system protein DruA [Sedimenticola sp.]